MPGIRVKRPKLYTLLCVHSWIPVIINFVIAFSPAVKKEGQFYPVLYCLTDCLLFVALIGVWYMKRWGTELFIIAFFCYDILLIFLNRFSFIGEFGYISYSFYSYIVFIAISVVYYRRMDRNL